MDLQNVSFAIQPAITAVVLLATTLRPHSFYPRAWHGLSHVHLADIAALHKFVSSEYPAANMFDSGLTTNHMQEREY